MIDYQVNRDYIASTLCINKDRPELNCNGYCYLKTQMKKVVDLPVEEIPQLPIPSTDNTELVFTFEEQEIVSFEPGLEERNMLFYYSDNYHFNLSTGHFNPPRA